MFADSYEPGSGSGVQDGGLQPVEAWDEAEAAGVGQGGGRLAGLLH